MPKFEFYIDKFTSGYKAYSVEIEAETEEEAQIKAVAYADGEDGISVKETFLDSDVGEETGGYELYAENSNFQHNNLW